MATLNPNLKDFWLNDKGKLSRARHRVLYGGRASSKSWEFAGRVSQIAQEYKTRVLCVRRFQNKIDESVYKLIANQIDNFDLGGFDVQRAKILHENGSELAFYGIERNTDEIKSFEGADILWIEEAHNLTKAQWDILEPTIRKEGSEIWISFNPNLITDFVYERFVVNPPPNTISRLVNYPDNPFISKTMLSSIQARKDEDYEDYEHIYLGVPKSDDAGVVIQRKWLEKCIDAHKVLGLDLYGGKNTGYDVADDGADKNASVSVDGSVCIGIDEWKADEDELVKSCSRVLNTQKQKGGSITYDSIGVGAGCGSNFNNSDFNDHFRFNAGAKVSHPEKMYTDDIANKDFFANLKAQAWWIIADRAKNTYNAVVHGKHFESDELLSIDSDLCGNLVKRLISELATPKRDYDNNGRVKVESKKDLAKRDVASPNLADAFIMAYSKHLVIEHKPIGMLAPSRYRR